MEARLQHAACNMEVDEPRENTNTYFQHSPYPEQSSHTKNQIVVDPAVQDHHAPWPPSPTRSPLSQKNNDCVEAPPAKEIELYPQRINRKEPQWDIVAPLRKGVQIGPAPLARARPTMWAENRYDAQDVLPYFSVGQTILTSKTPRAVARCVLLTRDLQDVNVDWREGKIQFSVQLRYTQQLSKPKESASPILPTSYSSNDVQYKPPNPIQFRKLVACHEAGLPVRVLATGDFPTLPTVPDMIYKSTKGNFKLSSRNWQRGLVVLGFFWVTRVQEVEHSADEPDRNAAKCSGRSKWEFEFTICSTHPPPWWCPFPPEGAESEDGSVRGSPQKRRCTTTTSAHLPADVIMGWGEEMDTEPDDNKYTPYKIQFPREMQVIGLSSLNNVVSTGDAMQVDPSPTGNPSVSPDNPAPPRIQPSELGMSLDPQEWGDQDSIRPPQIRASLLLGWHCTNCGKLNPRVKWTHDQSCSLCKATTNKLVHPEWHRKAHTEAVGPIGTLYRLDDGGHQPKKGLHQMAARDLDNGHTCVEYWLAEQPMPIIAEEGRDLSMSGKQNGRRKKTPKMVDVSLPPLVSAPGTPPVPGPTSVPDTELAPNTTSTSQAANQSGPRHPDGGALKRDRDAAGSRAVFGDNTRMLFMHITCPQHPASLALVDAIFSDFPAQVPMERQINNALYKTGASTLSCHYTYLAGVGTHPMHTSSPAVDWKEAPNCVYDAHSLLVGLQSYSVSENQPKVYEFNQSIFVVGNGASGTSIFRFVHRAGDGPVGYMVFGASCYIEIIVGDGRSQRRTTKKEAVRLAEMLLAHGDALFTSTPLPSDAPIEVRVKRTGLAIVAIARYVPPESLPTTVVVPPAANNIEPPAPSMATHLVENTTPARGMKRKKRAASSRY